MKCMHCGSEWKAGKASVQKLTTCPFCGKPLQKETPPAHTLEESLIQIRDRFGMEPFRNGKMLVSLHSDLMPEHQKDRRLIGYFTDCGGNAFLESVLTRAEAEQSAALVRLAKRLYEDWLIREDAAKHICAVWWRVLGGNPAACQCLTEKKSQPEENKTTPAPDPVPEAATVPHKRIRSVPAGSICRKEDYEIEGISLKKYKGNHLMIRVPEGVCRIESWAFGGLLRGKKVEAVYLPDSLQIIADQAFEECKQLQRMDLPEGLQEIGISAFYGCRQLQGIRLPDSLTTIGARAFWNCKSLKEIRVPGSVADLTENLFWNCESLERVELCPGVQTIGECAFEWCKGLKTIVIPDTVTSIHPTAFRECRDITVQASDTWKRNHPDLLARIPQ